MNPDLSLRQLEHLTAVVDCKLSVSCAALKLGLAQSAVSRSLIALENSCGRSLFERHGRRLVRQTNFCVDLVAAARDVSCRMTNLRCAAASASSGQIVGTVRIGATHLQMRYVLPAVLARMQSECPAVQLTISQDLPHALVDQVLARTLDACICSEQVIEQASLETIDAYSWNRVLVALPGTPLLKQSRLTLKALADAPLITYIPGITGRLAFDMAFERAQLVPNITISAADSDVIKSFARHGHGIGVIADVAYDPKADSDLACRTTGSLFQTMRTRIAHRRDVQVTPALERFAACFREAAAHKRLPS